jgi:hypothetical protein
LSIPELRASGSAGFWESLTSGRLIGVGQVVPGGEGLRVVGAEDTLGVGEGLLVERDGPAEVPGRLVSAGEVVP